MQGLSISCSFTSSPNGDNVSSIEDDIFCARTTGAVIHKKNTAHIMPAQSTDINIISLILIV